MFSLRRPDRRSSAGVWIAPHEAITARERTLTRWPSAVVASMPVATPCSTTTRWTRVLTIIRAPASWASWSQVFTTDCLAPTRQPRPQ